MDGRHTRGLKRWRKRDRGDEIPRGSIVDIEFKQTSSEQFDRTRHNGTLLGLGTTRILGQKHFTQ